MLHTVLAKINCYLRRSVKPCVKTTGNWFVKCLSVDSTLVSDMEGLELDMRKSTIYDR